ncbi:hypothetical protein LEP1GSC043_4734 [Leptospira weilii str. Ecochallenge]|uniref:Uncharacterized protein n=1 Tax=Leptospira weilii str. Ecochallenge TaxID=1049986 RepID=N1U6S9_9LEPT|nr:hypothetical protein LEP1GSC043_4734 [Leptospira weilii str. Ecochallenge]
MSSDVNSGFPFYPFRDFLLGEVLLKTLLESGVSSQTAEEAILSHLSPGRNHFVCTPNAKKQTLLNLYPEKIRNLLREDREEGIKQEFRNMIKIEERMDLALELLEWLFSGFEDKRSLLIGLFSLFLNDKVSLQENFLDRLKKNYEEEILKDLQNLE